MWFEILPSFGIICAAIAAPHGIAYILNYVILGNYFRRSLATDKDRLQYLRDRRLTGSPYKVSGLENLPDEQPDEQTSEEAEKEGGEEAESVEPVEEECKEEN